MAQLVVTRAQDSFSSNREKLDFAEGIALLEPNENPFTLMTMKFGRKTSGNIKHSWLFDELVAETDTADTTSASVTAATFVQVNNIDRWGIGDIGFVEKSHETFLVTAVSTGNDQLTIIRDYGATSGAYTALAQSFDDDDVIKLIGNAFEQGHILPTQKSTTEVQLDNWLQTQRTPFGVSEVAAGAAVRGEADWPFQMRKANKTHLRKIEWQNIFGHPMPGDRGLSSSGTGNDNPATGGGILHYLTGGTGFVGTGSDRLLLNAEITKAEFLTWIQHCFRYGSANRVLLCAPLFRTAFDSWGLADLRTVSEKTVFGLKVLTWVSSHGTITIVTHKMLEDQGGGDGAYAFMLDMEDIKWVTYAVGGSTRLRMLEPYKATGATIRQAEFYTISCIEIRVTKKHGCMYGTTGFAEAA